MPRHLPEIPVIGNSPLPFFQRLELYRRHFSNGWNSSRAVVSSRWKTR
jgi:hypothetical protein